MTVPDPVDTYLVGGAALPLEEAPARFEFPTARGFQRAALEWIEDGDEPVGLLAAPTGGGKTAIIAQLAEASDRILCLYPTNALIEAQAETLRENHNLSVDVLTGKTLTKKGAARSQEVMTYATDPAGADVVITNPDVLQAILQGLYFSPGSELLRFFAHFDAAVYDEFHYYDPVAASGLLMQIKVLSERGRYLGADGERVFPRVLLPSATPSRAFVDHVEEDLELNVERIRSEIHPLDTTDGGAPSDVSLAYKTGSTMEEYVGSQSGTPKQIDPHDPTVLREMCVEAPESLDRFRYPMVVNRWGDRIEDSFELVARLLRESVGLDEGDTPNGKSAIIFNSAARSNRFQDYLISEGLDEWTVKDNGYDTGADRSLPEKFAILNTTSKGEVGLDFNLNRLVMVKPFTGSDFVQRIGRAGRHSPAIVDVFGLDDPLWPRIQSYPAFLGRVLTTLGDPAMDRGRLRDLIGLRAARALQGRFEDDHYHVADVREDFGDFETRNRWQSFLSAVADARSLQGRSENPFAPQLDRPTSKTVSGIDAALDGLDSLRGRSLGHDIEYPQGDNRERTSYDLVTALRHYSIDHIRDGVVVFGDGSPGHVVGYYAGKPAEGRGIDLGHSNYSVDRDLTDTFETHASAASWHETEIDASDVDRFFQVLDLSSAMVPHRIETDGYVINTSQEGEILDVTGVG